MASKAPSPQGWARLQQRLAIEGHSRGTIFNLAESRLRRGIDAVKRAVNSRQPVWKPLAGVSAVALVIGLVLTLPLFLGQPQEVLAAEIAQNDPQVYDLLPEGTVIKVTKVVKPRQGNIFHVLFVIPGESVWGEEAEGESITIDALVDVRAKKVVGLRAMRTEGFPLIPLSAVDKRKAAEIAKADSRVQEILDSGAEIRRVIPLPFFQPSKGSLAVKVAGVVLTTLSLDFPVEGTPGVNSQRWTAVVDLDEERVVKLIESPPPENSDIHAGSGGSMGYLPITEE